MVRATTDGIGVIETWRQRWVSGSRPSMTSRYSSICWPFSGSVYCHHMAGSCPMFVGPFVALAPVGEWLREPGLAILARSDKPAHFLVTDHYLIRSKSRWNWSLSISPMASLFA
jgi:hypothetical protein